MKAEDQFALESGMESVQRLNDTNERHCFSFLKIRYTLDSIAPVACM